MSTTGANLPILVDTQALVWVGTGSKRLTVAAREALLDADLQILVSAVTAYEFVDLNRRGRFGAELPFAPLLRQLGAKVVDYPAEAWMIAERLPALHFDPVDRMLVAHAMHADITLVTADARMREYPVRTLW